MSAHLLLRRLLPVLYPAYHRQVTAVDCVVFLIWMPAQGVTAVYMHNALAVTAHLHSECSSAHLAQGTTGGSEPGLLETALEAIAVPLR